MNKICNQCSNKFISNYKNQVFCDIECRNYFYEKQKISKNKEIYSTTQIGAIAENFVCYDLLLKNYQIFKQIVQSNKFDLVAYKNNNLIKIEVRTGWYTRDKSISWPKHKQDDCDIYAVYIHVDKLVKYFYSNSSPVDL